jgi:hypothetical protein
MKISVKQAKQIASDALISEEKNYMLPPFKLGELVSSKVNYVFSVGFDLPFEILIGEPFYIVVSKETEEYALLQGFDLSMNWKFIIKPQYSLLKHST